MDPRTCRFTKTHEWVHLDGDVATVGISEFAVRELTDLVYIELPRKGARVEPGDQFGEIESVKAVSDLYAPVAGEVIEVNTRLADDLSVLSSDPYGAGWIARIRVDNPHAADGLLDYAAYEAHCAAAGH
jgi:glycine cleavage system H protein